MKTKHGARAIAALVLPFAIGSAFAESPMASDTKIACSEVKYSSEFLA